MKTLYRYFRRRGLRYGIHGVNLVMVAVGIVAIWAAHVITDGSWMAMSILVVAMVAFRLIATIEKRPPPVQMINAGLVEVENSHLILSTTDLNAALDRVVEAQARRP